MRLAVAVVLATAVAACGGGGGTPEPPAPLQAVADGPWLVLGSSTAAGAGAPEGQGWVATLGRTIAPYRLTLTNAARGGSVTYQWLPAGAPRPPGRPATDATLDVDQVLPSAPSLVLLSFPSNDAMAGFAASETVANLLALRERARARGAVVLVLSSQPRDDAGGTQRATLRAVDDALARQLGHCFVDVHDALASPQGGIAAAFAAGDGMHLNADGHRLIHDRVWAAITKGSCTTAGP